MNCLRHERKLVFFVIMEITIDKFKENQGDKNVNVLDTARIEVKAGKGGDGAVSFRREKYVPDGGPAGGDGGRGGDVIFVVDEGLRMLMDFRYNRHFKAKPGEKGMNKGMHGRGSEDLIVKVPQGTTVKEVGSDKILVDLLAPGQTFTVAHGGRGGRGIFGSQRLEILRLRLLKMVNLVKKEPCY